MKAALEAWGAGSNLFHQGVARETDGRPGRGRRDDVEARRRPAGSSGRFAEHSALPTGDEAQGGRERRRPKSKKQPPAKISEEADRKAAVGFGRERKRQEAERQARADAIEADGAAVEKRAHDEEARGEKQKENLATAFPCSEQ
jgi:hypothetical protein